MNQELQEVKLQLMTEQEKLVELDNKVKQLEVRGDPDPRSAKKFGTLS